LYLKPFFFLKKKNHSHINKLFLLDEITVDLDVLARADLLRFLKKECEERGATIIYATHIFDGLEDWPSHIVCLGSFFLFSSEMFLFPKFWMSFHISSRSKLLCFQVYVAHGKLQLAMRMDKVKENSKLSLMVFFFLFQTSQ
jgi:CCR4-NOT complex subunit CAF16